VSGRPTAEDVGDGKVRLATRCAELVAHGKSVLPAIAKEKILSDETIATLTEEIDHLVAPFEPMVAKLDTIPGVDRKGAITVIVETGGDMSRFPTAGHLCSWGAMCPGQNESAGKRQSGRTCPGNRHLKAALCQAANAASRKRGSYLKDKFYRLKARRGHKRAVLAVGHEILLASYHMLASGQGYRDLGEHYLDQRDKSGTAKRLVRRLEGLGFTVSLTAAA